MKLLILTTFGLLLSYADLTVAQGCNINMIADAPDSRYTLNANGTLVDKKTGLMWMRCALGQTWGSGTCTGYAQSYIWQSALQMAESITFAGFSDWRLPNQAELQSLVENRCYEPAINLTAFPNATNDSFWSSSPFAYYDSMGTRACLVNFYDGSDRYEMRSSGYAVRLVRSGQ